MPSLERLSFSFLRDVAQPWDDSDLGATILEVAYGIKAKDAHDKYIVIGERAVEGPTKALVLGALWVEFIPALRHLPPWWPGASYQRKAVIWREEATALRHEPFEKAMSDFVSNSLTVLSGFCLYTHGSTHLAKRCRSMVACQQDNGSRTRGGRRR